MWYYAENNNRFGPVDAAFMASLIQRGAVGRQTSVWREGMVNWQEAQHSELKDMFVGIPPTLTSYSGPAASSLQWNEYTSQSTKKLWVWFALLVGAGLALDVFSFMRMPVIDVGGLNRNIFVMGIISFIAAFVISYILLYRFWAVIQDGKARTNPSKAVGFCFIPLFNIYWNYVATVGLAEDINRYCREKNIAAPVVGEGLATTWFALYCCSYIPFLNFLTAIPCLVIFIILMKQLTDVAARILEQKTPVVNF